MTASAQELHQMIVADWAAKPTEGMSPQELGMRAALLDATAQGRPATGSIASAAAVAWFTIDAQFTGEFKGWVAGLTLAEGPMSGQVYSNDFSRLTRTTHAFYYWMGLSYTSISFYDVDGNNLGYFEGSTSLGAVGAGAGVGAWQTM